MKKILSFWPLWTLLILVFLVLRPALTLSGSLGNIDWPIPPFSAQIKEMSQANFFVWNDKYLLTGLPTPNPLFWGWLFTAGWGKLPFGGEILSLANHFLILFLAGFFSFLFLSYFFKNKLAVFAGAVFYMFSPPVFNWFHIGFVFLLISYALLPLAMLFFIKATRDKVRWNYVVGLGLVYGVVGTIQMQSIFLWAVLFLSFALFDFIFARFSKEKLIIYFKVLFGAFGLAFLINFYWVLQIIAGNSPITQEVSRQVAETMLRLSSVPDLIQGFQLLGFHDPQYEFILSSYGIWGLLIPGIFTSLVWAAVIFPPAGNNRKIAGFFFLIYVVSIPLTLGYNAPTPLSDLYGAFVKIPLLGILFRGSYKFWLLGAIAFAYLLTATLDRLLAIARLKLVAIPVVVLLAGLLTIPFYFHFVESQEPYRWPDEYRVVGDWLSNQPGEFKVVFLPSETYIFLKDKKYHVLDFPNFASPKAGSLGVANAGVTGNNYITFLNMIINEVSTESLGEFLGIEGIKYVVFQDNVIAKSWETLGHKGPVEELLKEKLNHQRDLIKKFKTGVLTVYENKNFRPLVYAAVRPEVVSGDFNYLLNASFVRGPEDKSSPIFLDSSVIRDNSDIIKRLINRDGSTLVIQDDSFIDLVLSQTSEFIEIPLGKHASGYFNEDKWGVITNAFFFRNINYTASLYNPILAGSTDASFSGQLKVPFKILENHGPYLILVKAYVGPKASKIHLGLRNPIKNKSLFEEAIETFSAQEQGFRWFKTDNFPLGDFKNELTSSLLFTVESFSGENAIEKIILIPKDEFLKASKIIEDILPSKELIISSGNFNSQKLFIPREGQYNLFVKLNNKKQKDNILLFVDNQKMNLQNLNQNQIDGEFFTVKIYLTKGEHNFAFNLINQPKILDDPSFEQGVWSGVLDSNPDIPTPSFLTAEQANEAMEGTKSLKLMTRGIDHAAAVCQSLKQFNNSSLYSFAFDYKGSEETFWSSVRFAFWQNVDDRDLPQWPSSKEAVPQRPWTIFGPQGSLPTKNNEWNHYGGIFEPFSNAQVGGLCFFADPGEAKLIANFYDNVKIKEIPLGSIVLMNGNHKISPEIQTPDIVFTKVDPANYDVIVKGATQPFILVLSESFNPGWRLSFPDLQNSLDEQSHFKINGFANAWYLEQKGDFQVRLQFLPQRYFLPGILISLLTFLGGLLFLGFRFIFKVKDEKKI